MQGRQGCGHMFQVILRHGFFTESPRTSPLPPYPRFFVFPDFPHRRPLHSFGEVRGGSGGGLPDLGVGAADRGHPSPAQSSGQGNPMGLLAPSHPVP